MAFKAFLVRNAKGFILPLIVFSYSLFQTARVHELLGRNTLAIYVMHWWIEILAMRVMRSFFSQNVWMPTSATLITLALAVFVPCLISELINKPKLKWILGK